MDSTNVEYDYYESTVCSIQVEKKYLPTVVGLKGEGQKIHVEYTVKY